ncbi:hypothetical protein OV203_20310 [Nannocystis sp. ILAH1]|uniref:hypothetical protein n=1 Tax=Nannocystis sp. ILAH1 TaxID=2996789 RepID=UPI00226E42E7|nr:hypothetical protein [Nannocystis sp. ILAH1]MCY0989495.1 hypothetical protein [Nannocystis sp. ILAH1]
MHVRDLAVGYALLLARGVFHASEDEPVAMATLLSFHQEGTVCDLHRFDAASARAKARERRSRPVLGPPEGAISLE